MIRVTPIEDEL